MAIQKYDELNLLAIPYEQYFGEMGISEREKQRRIALAESIDDIFILLFMLIQADISLGNEISEAYYIDYIDRNYRDLLEEKGIDVVEKYPWLAVHIRDMAHEIIRQNIEKPDDEWVTSEDRAMVIAENEANSIGEYTQFQDAVDTGKTRKTWHTMLDRRVRHTHEELESLTIPIMETFKVGAYEMYQPKDDSLGAGLEEIAGCRCWCTYS
jgi:hypothetical protein